jgi:hypothetical protein
MNTFRIEAQGYEQVHRKASYTSDKKVNRVMSAAEYLLISCRVSS